jgi:GNAT superfamily N-acetyltransferase
VIRDSRKEDIPKLLQLGLKMAQEAPEYVDCGYDEQKVEQLLISLQESASGIVLVAEDSGQIIGMLLGGVAEYFFSREIYAFDLAVYVTPEKRGSRHFLQLIKHFERWCIELGVPTIKLGISTGNQVGEIYTRLGYEKTGELFRKNLGGALCAIQ